MCEAKREMRGLKELVTCAIIQIPFRSGRLIRTREPEKCTAMPDEVPLIPAILAWCQATRAFPPVPKIGQREAKGLT